VSLAIRISSICAKNPVGSWAVDQHASSVEVVGNLALEARRDLAVIGSRVSAAQDLSAIAGENLTLAAAANEDHEYSKGKKGKTKTTIQEDEVSQQSAELKAGGDLIAVAGKDLTLVASKISAGDEAYVHADNELNMLAAQDSNYSLYDMQKKGSWGSKKTQRDEVTDVKNIGSEITTGGDLTLSSGGDQTYQGAKLESGGDLTIASGGAVTFEAVKDLHQESHEKSDNNAFWVSGKGKGNTDETLRQTQMLAAGDIVIKAVDGLNIDVKQVNQQTVSQSIDAMVQADPQLAWLKQAEARGDVNWQQVKEIHDSFKYSNSGLGPASQLIIAIVMAAVVGPMALTAAGGAAGAAVATSAATNAAISVVNNRGNLGAVLKDVTSSTAMKGYVVAGVTAGLTSEYFNGWTSSETNAVTGKIATSAPLSTWQGAGQFASKQVLQNGTSMLLNKALGQGGSASDALKIALFNTLAAVSFNAVGDYTKNIGLDDGSLGKIVIHAMVGGLLAEATGGDFKTGALAAGANEALVKGLDKLVGGNKDLLSMSSQIVGVLAAASQEDADAAKMEKGAWVAQNATEYNYLNHTELADLERESSECKAKGNCAEVKEKFRVLSVANDDQLAGICAASTAMCIQQYNYLVNESKASQLKIEEIYANDSVPLSIKLDLPVYNLQNINSTGAVVQAGVTQNLISKGVSQENAQLAASILAVVAGGVYSKNNGAKATTKVMTEFGPMNQGLLPKGIADTFRSGTYSEVVTQQPTTLYRVMVGLRRS
jgi:filamentous hemagglutinin